MRFNYFLPVNLVFGRGRTEEAGAITAMWGNKVLLVTGQKSTKKSGLLEKVTGILRKSGLEVTIFDKVSQNPTTTVALEGAAVSRELGCQVIVGLGGGSIMDCAKAIAFLSVNDGDINDYIFNRRIGDRALPLIQIPTTCGTGSEANGFAVLTNPENGDKKSLRCNAMSAKAAIVDSELMETMPEQVLASVGFDALCHSMEAFLSRYSQPFTDMMSLNAMELIGRYLPGVYEGDKDSAAWDAVTWASTLGGMAINTAGVTLPHGMEHPVSGKKNVVHGQGLAALTPVIAQASIPGAPEKYSQISIKLGGKGAGDCVEQLEKLLQRLRLRKTLSEFGICRQDIPWLVENCYKVSSAGIAGHPVVFTREEMARLYQEAL